MLLFKKLEEKKLVHEYEIIKPQNGNLGYVVYILASYVVKTLQNIIENVKHVYL